MYKPLFKTSPVIIFSTFILTLSAYSQASNDCDQAYQWSGRGPFFENDVVRYKGLAYKATTWTLNQRPDQSPVGIWEHLGACSVYTEVKCDFNGDGRMDSARGFPYVDLVGAVINAAIANAPVRENASYIDTGEVTVTYNHTAADQQADFVWNQNILGMNAYARTNAHFGEQLSIGDFNNDNFCDLVISAPDFSYQPAVAEQSKGLVNVLYGSPNGLTTLVLGESGRPINPYDAQRFDQDSPDVPGAAEAGDQFGKALASGDFNDDGYDDIAIGVPGESVVVVPQLGDVKKAGYFHILYGSRSGIQTSSPKSVAYLQHIGGVPLQEVEKNDLYGAAIVAADFDNDGYVDLAISAPGEDQSRGKISLFRGSSVGMDMSSRKDFSLSNFKPHSIYPGTYFGRFMKVTDFNADGFLDLEVHYIDNTTPRIFEILRISGSASGLIINN